MGVEERSFGSEAYNDMRTMANHWSIFAAGRQLMHTEALLDTQRGKLMKNKFKTGDYVSWNSEAGRVSGTIVRVHMRNFDVKGYTHHASGEAPQYGINSSKTEHVAFHKGSALTRLRD